MYLQNIHMSYHQTDEDIVKSVYKYATDCGLRIISARVIHNRYADDTVGCRVIVPKPKHGLQKQAIFGQ